MELEINGNTAEVNSEVIAITRQSLDVENQTTRAIDITNQFNLPKSEKNNKIFNSAYIINSNNDGLDKYYQAKLIDQFYLFNGRGFIKELTDVYKFQLVDGSKDLFDSLKGNINELGWDSQDIIFNYAGYQGINYSQDTLFVFPLIAMHEEKTATKSPVITSDADLTFYRPCFRYGYILKKAFEANDWTLDYDSDIIDLLAMSSNAEQFYVTSYQKKISETITATAGGINIDLSTPDFEKVTSITSTTISDTYNTIIRLRGSIECDSVIKISIEATYQPSGKTKINEYTVNSNTTEIDIKTSEFTKDDTDTSVEIGVKVYGSGDITFSETLLYTLIEEQNLGAISDNNLIDYKIKAHDNMPTIKQIDLFRDAMIRSISIIKPSSITKTITLETLRYLSKLKAYDWSAKIDQESETVYSKLGNLSQKNIVSYDNDDSIDANVGLSSFETENETLENEGDYFKFEFSASEDVVISSEVMASMGVYDDDERINDELNNRIFYLYDKSTYYIGQFDELTWENIKETFYKNWFESLRRVRVIECLFNLNKLDVLGFDFTKLVYVDYFKSYFYVYKIENFTPNTKTKVKMIKFL